ncbi:MAG: BrnT family toxin [Armatimonadota bacterium]|nr:BrnT family toxin [Armatimonadota bacterium]
MRFEWDDTKSRLNYEKHGVTFLEAATVFADALSILKSDPLHSEEEERLILLGQSKQQRFLVVVHRERGDSIRIISARLATARERRNYEED